MLIVLFFFTVFFNISAADELEVDEFILVDKSPEAFMRLIDQAKKDGKSYRNSFVYNEDGSYIKRFGSFESNKCFSRIDSVGFLNYFKKLAALFYLSDAQKLDPRYVMIPYWQELQLNQNKKLATKALQDVYRNNIDSLPNYPIGRLMYAAALHAGADPNVELCVHSNTKLLKISLMYKDCALTELLLQKGADPNAVIKTDIMVWGRVRHGDKKKFPLACVKTLKELELLLEHGAHPIAQEQQSDALSHLCALSLQEQDPSILATCLNHELLQKAVDAKTDVDSKWCKELKDRLHYVILKHHYPNKNKQEVYINIVAQALDKHIAKSTKTVTWHEPVTELIL
jgi:hypothetical protein